MKKKFIGLEKIDSRNPELSKEYNLRNTKYLILDGYKTLDENEDLNLGKIQSFYKDGGQAILYSPSHELYKYKKNRIGRSVSLIAAVLSLTLIMFVIALELKLQYFFRKTYSQIILYSCLSVLLILTVHIVLKLSMLIVNRNLEDIAISKQFEYLNYVKFQLEGRGDVITNQFAWNEVHTHQSIKNNPIKYDIQYLYVLYNAFYRAIKNQTHSEVYSINKDLYNYLEMFLRKDYISLELQNKSKVGMENWETLDETFNRKKNHNLELAQENFEIAKSIMLEIFDSISSYEQYESTFLFIKNKILRIHLDEADKKRSKLYDVKIDELRLPERNIGR